MLYWLVVTMRQIKGSGLTEKPLLDCSLSKNKLTKNLTNAHPQTFEMNTKDHTYIEANPQIWSVKYISPKNLNNWPIKKLLKLKANSCMHFCLSYRTVEFCLRQYLNVFFLATMSDEVYAFISSATLCCCISFIFIIQCR